jgi:monoamine oxidase
VPFVAPLARFAIVRGDGPKPVSGRRCANSWLEARKQPSVESPIAQIGRIPGALMLDLAGADPMAPVSEVYRRAAAELFGERVAAPISYMDLRRTLDLNALSSELEPMVGHNAKLRARLFEGELTPLELFAARASEVEAGRATPKIEERHDDDGAKRADVVIIGAGMAGLAAAQDLIAKGYSVVVLEASAYPGGRTYTDREHFHDPVDFGAMWIHGGATNPMTELARKLGFTLVPDDAPHLAYDGRSDPRIEGVRFMDRMNSLSDHIKRTAEKGLDVAATHGFRGRSKWDKIAEASFGPLDFGVPLSSVSSKDFAITADEVGDYYVSEGLGTLVEAFGHGVPIRCNTEVSEVQQNDDGVEVTAAGQKYRARYALVTVSTGVLGAGTIAFEPQLPQTKLDAIQGVPMGLLDKIVLEFDRNICGDIPHGTHARDRFDPRRPMEMIFRPNDVNEVVALVGDEYARILEEQPARAVTAAVTKLRRMFGPVVDESLVRAAVTRWHLNRHTRGAYSAARPGDQHLRKELVRPFGRVHFAGEAGHDVWAGCLTGAYLTGKDSAVDLAKLLEATVEPDREVRAS